MYNRNFVTREGLKSICAPKDDRNKEDFAFVYHCLRIGRIYQDVMVFIPVDEGQPADGEQIPRFSVHRGSSVLTPSRYMTKSHHCESSPKGTLLSNGTVG